MAGRKKERKKEKRAAEDRRFSRRQPPGALPAARRRPAARLTHTRSLMHMHLWRISQHHNLSTINIIDRHSGRLAASIYHAHAILRSAL
jgi:hypothetical protein